MPEKPVSLKSGSKWINISALTHIDFDEKNLTATLYVGAVPVLLNSKEAYAYLHKRDGESFFTEVLG